MLGNCHTIVTVLFSWWRVKRWGAKSTGVLTEKDLKRWRLLERFQEAWAAEMARRGEVLGTWEDPRRQLQWGQYLSLFLFGLFNLVVKTMRGLCAASDLSRVQREVCDRLVSLGSFSEAQAVVDFVVRLRENVQWVEENSEPLSAADQAAGVTWGALCGWARRVWARGCA